MGKRYSQLDLAERRKLERLLAAGFSKSEIADQLKRDRSTIFREIRRNYFSDPEMPQYDGYYCLTADSKAQKRRGSRCKLARDKELRDAVLDRLKTGWSPEQISGRLRLEEHPKRICHETIYRFAYSKTGKSENWFRHLPEHRRTRRKRGSRRRHGKKFPEELWIKERPEAVSEREEFGHWECDLMIFRRRFGKANVMSVVERVSRYTLLLKNPDRTSKPVMNALIGALFPLPQTARRCITFDRGSEFSAWDYLKEGLGVDPWFCDPSAPWQKGTNENTNGRARRDLPRDLDPAEITRQRLQSICDRMNATPRKCLGFRTPTEVFREKMLEVA